MKTFIEKWDTFVINEASWSIPQTTKDSAKLALILKKLKAKKYKNMKSLKEELYNVMGDDILFDKLNDDWKRDKNEDWQANAFGRIVDRLGEIISDYRKRPASFKNKWESKSLKKSQIMSKWKF